MRYISFVIIVIGIMLPPAIFAQRITYSAPNKEDYRQTNFEVVGRIDGNILVYKNNRNKNDISLFDNDMKLKQKVNLDFLPKKLVNVDFITFANHFFMVYEHQEKNVVYCNVVKMDGAGNKLIGPVQIDTTEVNGNPGKIYSTIHSEDKKNIVVFKINKKNERNYVFSTLLYNDNMEFVKKSVLPITTQKKDGVFSDFIVDNEGDFVFTRCSRNGPRDNISHMDFVIKPASEDTFLINNVPLTNHYLDEIKLRADNINRTYLISSLYYGQRKGNVEGLYIAVWDKAEESVRAESFNVFNEQLREDAKSENTTAKTAFNDYFIRQILPKKDGGFLVVAELYFTSSRGGGWNRYDYLYPGSMYGYSPYRMSPFGYGYNPWNRYNGGSSVRYYSENIAVFSFDANAGIEWSNVLHKSLFDDYNSDGLSYMMYNTGGEIRFLYNQLERRVKLLAEQGINANGDVKRAPTFKNLSKDYEFLPKYGKQIGVNQVIVPCVYRNYICFAKIDF